MKWLIIILFFIPNTIIAQVYKWGASEKYHKEDSVFIVWEHTLPKVYTDSAVLSVINIINDSILKIAQERHISRIMVDEDKDNYNDSLVKAVRPMLIEQLKKDTTKKSIYYKSPFGQDIMP